MKYAIGIDVGGTKILVALLNEDFRLVAEIKTKTKPEKGESNFLQTIRDSVRSVLKDAGVDSREVIGAGIGCPGFIQPESGFVTYSPNIPFLKGYPLAKVISKMIDVPVAVGNDVQTGLYGEHQFGAAKNYRHVIGIFLGTGIGGALILDGKLFRGATGSAGEFGHIQVDPNPMAPRCGCGRRGCLEAYGGRLGISAEAAIGVARQRAPHLASEAGADLRRIKSGALARAIQSGDRYIEDLIRHKAQMVGFAMANLVNIINPEIIVLGGGVVEAMPNLIVREAERAMHRQAIAALVKRVRVAPAKLKDYSIVMGAAKRAADRFGERHG
ncbi:MAG TPA: ROK family protein [Elusimicrobiota bacterium]|nr:ROK family protein [Elusimicrobiota bacterium]